MKDEGDKRKPQAETPVKNPGKVSRQDRLKLALRENLKRRKSQAKGRSDPGVASSDADDASPYGSGNKPGG